MKFRTIIASAVLANAIGIAPAFAGEPVTVHNDRFESVVSATGQSRISIVGEKIHSAHGMTEPGGPRTTAEVDEATGDLYISFDGQAVGKTFSIFLTTISGRTYQAVLKAQAVESQTVLVQPDPSRRVATPDAAPEGSLLDHHEDYSQVLVGFIRVMFNDITPEGGSRVAVDDRPKRAGPFLEQEIERFSVSGLVGHVLSVRNMTKDAQSLDSARFLLPGVLAATVSHELVAPGDYARIYVVEAGQ